MLHIIIRLNEWNVRNTVSSYRDSYREEKGRKGKGSHFLLSLEIHTVIRKCVTDHLIIVDFIRFVFYWYGSYLIIMYFKGVSYASYSLFKLVTPCDSLKP